MPRSPEVTDAYLRLQAARRVHEACLCRLEASFIVGSPEQVELSISALLDSSQTLADRLRDQVFAQLRDDGIDPITRRSL
ncbi:hypothetical protein [Bradyrhizobium elkanii]|uniref:Uncharacterized protein n=1 Tax=Bradyrhizobium elkanii TaxID=29448 RepID=A0ABV4F3W3_BRAEL|nr:hypothetical protein [Bradyrhizobium elkanii]MCS3890498.1 hypothetical protein [Bradyrhizobium elkanii]MCS4219902.1 hypothetical protein [Bradyrhizobium elkanii]WLB13689.1 hypothetical protein QIH87_22845 [Bradyrhizobium elkanii]